MHVLRHIALLTIAASTVGATLSGMRPAPPASAANAPASADTITLSCGGYDESGEVVNEAAVAIGTFEVPATGPIEIPPVCGGYTDQGTFIGDD